MIGIGSPLPSGIPGFNQAGMYVDAGAGGGAVNATPLPSWYNVVRNVVTDNDSVSLPPATCGGTPVVVMNVGTNDVMVFGSTNPAGIPDLVDGADTGVVVAAGSLAMFWATTPQGGFTNAWTPGEWTSKVIA